MKQDLYYQTKKLSFIGLTTYVVFLVVFYFLAIHNHPQNASTFFGRFYWLIFGVISIGVVAYIVYSILKAKKRQKCIGTLCVDVYIKYSFLLQQLVARDFKSKYKRSVLGVLWSFLNPLLMMLVQYIIFSTLFGNASIKCYPVYLICGVVIFNFFSESCGMGLTSIVGNAPLITKVYVPKYIYPVSRVISSMINLAFSLIPLFLIMLISGVWPSLYHLLLLIDLFLLVMFCMGLTLLLSSVMVFFRDMQFLWSVIITIWMYATPIFYSLDMFAGGIVVSLLKFNPLYQYLTFARIVLIEGTSPALSTYVWCILSSIIMFLIGLIVFKKTQNKFVLYI